VIEARKNVLFERLFLGYSRRLLARHFRRVTVAGAGMIRKIDRQRPIIFCCNHSSWWDGILPLVLSHDVVQCRSFGMMEEKQLARYRFFRWIGVFSVVRESPRQAVKSMAYASSLFTEPNTALWIFPQGVLGAQELRPLRLEQGAARIAAMAGGAQFVPVAFRFEFLCEQLPEAFISFGEPWTPAADRTAREVTSELERRLTDLVDGLRQRVVDGNFEDFTPLVAGKASVNVRLDTFRALGARA
jgi:chlorobactene lauroyltransferase